MATVTNQKASQALNGESVLVTLNAADSAKLAAMTIGQTATLGSNSKVGYVNFIDLYGHSFKLKPAQYDKSLDSAGNPGYLKVNEVITLS